MISWITRRTMDAVQVQQCSLALAQWTLCVGGRGDSGAVVGREERAVR